MTSVRKLLALDAETCCPSWMAWTSNFMQTPKSVLIYRHTYRPVIR